MIGEIFVGGMFGLVLGSFAGALSYRLVNDQDWIAKRSSCPQCGMQLGIADLIPLFGFMLRRGKCAHCAQPISWRYPIIEIVNAFGCILAVATFGTSINAAFVIGLATILVAMAAADFEAQILPDELQIALAILGAGFAYQNGTFLSGLTAGVLGAGLGLLLRTFYRRVRKIDALGLGDIKFFGAAGLWIGLDHLSWFLGLSALIGVALALVMGKGMKDRIPFGVALAIALFVLVVGRPIASF